MSFIQPRVNRFAFGVVLGALTILAIYGLFRFQQDLSGVGFSIPEIPVHASASASNNSFMVATGAIDNDMEALYCLDPLTGALSCWVMNRNTGKFTAVFKYPNVMVDLGDKKDKDPEFLLLTGRSNFRSITSALRPAQSVAYVVNSTNGKVAAYSVPWSQNLWQNEGYTAELKLLDTGVVRKERIRD